MAAIFACVLSAAILFVLLRTGWAWDIAVDIPNHRSLHTRPVPRVGGWGVLPAVVIAVFLFAPGFRLIALGALALGVVSQIDDRRGLPARVRFAAHLIVVLAGLALSIVSIAWWMAILGVLALVWVVNLYNFMDGSDGLAGGMTLFGFGFYAIAAASVAPSLGIMAAAVAGAGLGFLFFNHHPAKIFLGDAGSIPLGFLAGVLGFWGWQHGIWPIWFPALVFFSLHSRCHRDAPATPGPWRESLACAPGALLSKMGKDCGQPCQGGSGVLFAYGGRGTRRIGCNARTGRVSMDDIYCVVRIPRHHGYAR